MSNSNPDFRGDGSTLSIEETNKIRIELGLKPLEINDNDGPEENGSEISRLDNFVHVPAKNIGAMKSKEKMENKLKMHREARERNDILATEKSLGEAPIESTNDFLRKVREKKAAEDARKIAREAAETEDADSDDNRDLSYQRQLYRSADLSGIPIEHKASRFELTGPTILTLKDRAILDDDADDVLVNVNLLDEEVAERNMRHRKMGAYGSYVDSGDEDDPLACAMKPASVLAKYDEVMDGPKRARFTLDARGTYDMGQERAEEEIRNSFFHGKSHYQQTPGSDTHGGNENRIASDYYTEEEVRFKMKKRRARGVRTVRGGASMQQQHHSTGHGGGHTGSAKPEPMSDSDRDAMKKPKKEEGELAEDDGGKRKKPTKQQKVAKNLELDFSSEDDDDYYRYRPTLVLADIQSTTVNEELRHKLEMMRKSTGKVAGESRIVKDEPQSTGSEAAEQKLVLTTTEEYTKSIFSCLQSKRKADTEINTVVKEEPVTRPAPVIPAKTEVKDEEPVQSSGWQPEEKILLMPTQPAKKKRNFREQPLQPVPAKKKKLKLTDGVLGDEVQINAGIYSTLMLAKNKGYLDDNKSVPMISNPKNQMLRAQNFQEEKIRYDDIDQKCPRRERRNLPETSFQDKANFTPDIKLDYLDEFGRSQPPKEAFRSLSHRFHGKTSGKIKSEKRSKKMQEQSKISCETEMKSVSKMHSKMKSENRYCVPLSGKNSIIPAAIKKSEKK